AWAELDRLPNANGNVHVTGNLTKLDLMNLYSNQMVGSKGKARSIYDDILAAAGGFCPLCGELGQARTLDHYLPKANFPAYSVFPENLVPCCRDCNTGKNSSFPATRDKQALHPYLDKSAFFEER